MPAPTELLDLHVVSLHPPGVGWVGGFQGMEALVRFLMEHADPERSYCVSDVANNIRAVALFNGDSLLLLTSGGEVVRDGQRRGDAAGDQPEPRL